MIIAFIVKLPLFVVHIYIVKLYVFGDHFVSRAYTFLFGTYFDFNLIFSNLVS